MHVQASCSAVASGWAPAGHCHAMFADGGLAQLAVTMWRYMTWIRHEYDDCNPNFVSVLQRFAMFWCLATPRSLKTGQALRSSWRTAGWKRMRMQDTEGTPKTTWTLTLLELPWDILRYLDIPLDGLDQVWYLWFHTEFKGSLSKLETEKKEIYVYVTRGYISDK